MDSASSSTALVPGQDVITSTRELFLSGMESFLQTRIGANDTQRVVAALHSYHPLFRAENESTIHIGPGRRDAHAVPTPGSSPNLLSKHASPTSKPTSVKAVDKPLTPRGPLAKPRGYVPPNQPVIKRPKVSSNAAPASLRKPWFQERPKEPDYIPEPKVEALPVKDEEEFEDEEDDDEMSGAMEDAVEDLFTPMASKDGKNKAGSSGSGAARKPKVVSVVKDFSDWDAC
jgi:hypothetical protein